MRLLFSNLQTTVGKEANAYLRNSLRKNVALHRLPRRQNYSTGNPPHNASRSARKNGIIIFSTATALMTSVALLYVSNSEYKFDLHKFIEPNSLPFKQGSSPDPGTNTNVKEGKVKSFKDYQKLYNHIAHELKRDERYDDGSFGPILVRLSWHASGTYSKETNSGGSNGATMRFAPEANHSANAGLCYAIDFMERIHKIYPWISYSDLWTLGGVVSIQEMGGPKIPWRPGRLDLFIEDCTPDGRLPDAAKGCDHLRKIFNRMGFNDQEIVALSGAHALGRCHADRLGYEGPWTHSPTYFTNEYYNLLLNEDWNLKNWAGSRQYQDGSSGKLMMLREFKVKRFGLECQKLRNRVCLSLQQPTWL